MTGFIKSGLVRERDRDKNLLFDKNLMLTSVLKEVCQNVMLL